MGRVSGERINKLDNPEQYKVAVYIRTGGKVDGLDVVKFQKDRVEEYCNELELKVLNEYIDEGIDLVNKNRPAYNKLIQDIKDGKINMVITANLTRISRSQKEVIDLLNFKKDYDFKMLFADSREELTRERVGIDLKKYLENEEKGLDELEDEEYQDDMEY